MANTAIIDFIFNSQQAMRGISKFKEKLSQTMDAIANSASGKMGALGTALIGFGSIKSMLSEVKKVADFSTIYGKNIEAISSFNNLMAQFGGNTDESLQVYGQLQDALTQLRTSASGAYKALATKLQINFWDETAGRFKNSAQILQEIRKNWHRLSEEGKQDALKTLGINLPAVRRYLEASNAEMMEARKNAADMPKLTEKEVRLLAQTQKSWAIIKASFLQVGGVILVALAKPIEYLGKAAKWLSKQDEGVRTSIVGIIAGLGMLTPLMKTVQLLATGIGWSFNAMASIAGFAIKFLSGALIFLAARIVQIVSFLIANPIIALIAGIAAAAYLIYENWDKIKEYFTLFVDWIKEKATKLSNIFGDIFHGLVEWIKNILSKIPVIGKMISAELKDQEAEVELKETQYRDPLQKLPTDMTMIPRGEMLKTESQTNNNTTSNNRTYNNQRSNVSTTYNVTFNGVSNAEDINNNFTQIVRQGTTGVK